MLLIKNKRLPTSGPIIQIILHERVFKSINKLLTHILIIDGMLFKTTGTLNHVINLITNFQCVFLK